MTSTMVELVENTAALDRLAPAWADLWRRARSAPVFLSPAWLVPWWRAFHPGELRIVAVRSGGQLVGLAPLYREDGPLGQRLLPIGISVSDHLDLLVDPDRPEAGAALLTVCGDDPDWTSLELEELHPRAAALDIAAPDGMDDVVVPQNACPTLSLSGRCDPHGLPIEIPPDRRRKVRRAWRAAGRLGGLEIEAMDDTEQFVSELARLNSLRWRARGEGGLQADKTLEGFHRDCLPGLLARGLARLRALSIGGKTVAVYYGLRHGATASAYLGGFDPDYAEASPGSILIADAVAEAAQDGATEFDFLRGQEPYKYLWGARDVWNRKRTLRRDP